MIGRITVAIDGPAGAGKSTVARRLARTLGLAYLDTGAMYRAVTWKAIREEIDPGDGRALAALVDGCGLELQADAVTGDTVVWLDGENVSVFLRRPEVNRLVSRVAAVPAVRERMVGRQRQLAAGGGVVAEGRDVGTEILPGAEVKFFLTASVGERAARRWDELRQQGFAVSRESIEGEIRERDRQDSQREVGPLKMAPGAILVDTTGKTADEVVAILVEHCAADGGRR